MLKALELNGFKSFADRTRLEFPSGITAVVGPNGSGKSNVVDAIKWVLGSQSAKALRGSEMTDVIFSGSRSRKQANAAEVTLSFDNSARILDVDDEVVHVTRRVLRSGEAEYLLNREVCRLRDIREIFAGIGVTTGAYSIIEQGKVDALLQSSPKERRLIFEEAAGVSRFKLKRQEATRRLERIEQNLLRLSDIVEELESRLRSVRSQAGRARKYKEFSDRLRKLRTQAGLADWRKLSATLETSQQEANSLRAEVEAARKTVAVHDEQVQAVEQATDDLQAQSREATSQSTSVRERIAQSESLRRSQLARGDELVEETQRLEKQLLSMSSRAGSAQQMVAENQAQLQESETRYDELEGQVRQQQAELDLAQSALAQCRSDLATCRSETTEAFRETTQLEHRIQVVESQHFAAITEGDRLRLEADEAREAKSESSGHFAIANDLLRQQEGVAQQAQQELVATQEKVRDHRGQLAKAQAALADHKGRLSGAKERSLVLEELERQLDGLSAGTKEVLRLAKSEPDGPFGRVRGVVADLLHVDADTASIVEIALGEKANCLVIEQVDSRMTEMAESDWFGRTSFLRLDVPLPASAVDRIDLSGEPGIIGRADQFVEIAPDLAPLARRLLARHWFVDSLNTAFGLSKGVGRGLNFVTVVGEVLTADGTLTVGPRQASMGLLSRRSELRALVDEIRDMQQKILSQQEHCTGLETAVHNDEQALARLTSQQEKASRAVNETLMKVASARDRLDRANETLSEAEAQLKEADEKATSAANELADLKSQLANRHLLQQRLQHQLNLHTEQASRLEQQVTVLQPSLTDIRVALARSEQRRDGLRHQMEQLRRDHQEHDKALEETRQRTVDCRTQQETLRQSVLDLTSELAELYSEKDRLTTELADWNFRLEQLRKERTASSRNAEGLRSQLLEKQSLLQQIELKQQQRENQRREIAERLTEDYRLDIALLAVTEPPVEIPDRPAVETEIRNLREQLSGVGPVNLEALSELEAIEERHASLAKQYQDLRLAKTRLEQLVLNINVESRDIFVQTLNLVRGHFQELYRSLFGGGEADIIMEESETDDVLECGIEIVARPPGKQPRSMSLLSGGERTMTCVALLLAIFRSRPTPFCVLDEVDAALDEANIDRFVDVLREFMSSTQFIVITHSKRTMSCSDTLYGITMQESGISKHVSVRFEDVSADGQIRQSVQSNQDENTNSTGAQAA
ncbi:chromosome segregation protein SMC [Bythopirellula polymerisocia]|uniref:Chromosome partition protein Smc n=1 Tax=Bythopirellula polymerisocia TaxID=2528003 RepID=A0A5C6C1J5_9BACT|nr:chromosome segregation protein SMC [Bythopirellula polymerisocia]TWU17837.1 Chromosome partition protein Smc [Bythopirellula polymerisocia]